MGTLYVAHSIPKHEGAVPDIYAGHIDFSKAVRFTDQIQIGLGLTGFDSTPASICDSVMTELNSREHIVGGRISNGTYTGERGFPDTVHTYWAMGVGRREMEEDAHVYSEAPVLDYDSLCKKIDELRHGANLVFVQVRASSSRLPFRLVNKSLVEGKPPHPNDDFDYFDHSVLPEQGEASANTSDLLIGVCSYDGVFSMEHAKDVVSSPAERHFHAIQGADTQATVVRAGHIIPSENHHVLKLKEPSIRVLPIDRIIRVGEPYDIHH